MNGIVVLLFTIYLIRIRTENITLNPGDENQYSILTGDTLTLLCHVNSSKKTDVRWSSMMNDTPETVLSIGENLNKADSRFRVAYTNHLKNMIYLMIHKITSKEQSIYKCFYRFESDRKPIVYKYNVRLAIVTYTLTKNSNGTVCCHLYGQNITAAKFVCEHQSLYGEHIRFIESVKNINSGPVKRDADFDIHNYNYLKSCLNLNKNRISKYHQEGEYICTAKLSIYGRNQTVEKTKSIKIENIQDRPFCIQDTGSQHSILGTNISIAIKFYSKPEYSAVSVTKNDSEFKLEDKTVNIKNISLDVYNVTVLVSGYEIIINITEFSEEDIGNYTANIDNGFGDCNCTVQLLCQGNDFPENNHTEKVVIENKTRAEITKSLQWYILACGSIIVVLLAMSALRSTFLKTVDNCSKSTIRKPSCHKNTKKQATKKHSTKKQAARKPRRAYSDQFMEVTLNQLNNGERILIIGQTNEMDASTETNI